MGELGLDARRRHAAATAACSARAACASSSTRSTSSGAAGSSGYDLSAASSSSRGASRTSWACAPERRRATRRVPGVAHRRCVAVGAVAARGLAASGRRRAPGAGRPARRRRRRRAGAAPLRKGAARASPRRGLPRPARRDAARVRGARRRRRRRRRRRARRLTELYTGARFGRRAVDRRAAARAGARRRRPRPGRDRRAEPAPDHTRDVALGCARALPDWHRPSPAAASAAHPAAAWRARIRGLRGGTTFAASEPRIRYDHAPHIASALSSCAGSRAARLRWPSRGPRRPAQGRPADRHDDRHDRADGRRSSSSSRQTPGVASPTSTCSGSSTRQLQLQYAGLPLLHASPRAASRSGPTLPDGEHRVLGRLVSATTDHPDATA